MTNPPNPAVDRAARILLFEHISELAWRVENISTTIQCQCAGADAAGALHSMGRLYLTVQCLKDAEKLLKAMERAERKELTAGAAGNTKESSRRGLNPPAE